MENIASELKRIIIEESYVISKKEALELYEYENLQELLDCADEIRKKCAGSKSDVCSIINAKQGACSENCSYCAQSAHWKTGCAAGKMIDPEWACDQAKKCVENKVKRLSLVTAGRGLGGKDFETGIECFRKMEEATSGKVKFCASFGIIGKDKMDELKKCGVVRYHHNLESGRNFYSKICTTHSYDERLETIKAAKEAGLEICSGGIIGLGESRGDRIDMAFELRNLGVHSVPVNVLNPIKGTPLESMKILDKEEILRTIAVFRFIMPDQVIRCAAGRKSLGKNGRDAFMAGSNALISGDFLTVEGSTNEEDLRMLAELGYEF